MRRPDTVSSDALYVLPNNVPFTLHKTGYWLECWFDQHSNVDRCKLTNENGKVSFEDTFLPCIGKEPLHQSVLVFNTQETGYKWTRSREGEVNVPVVVLFDGQVLLPQSFYAEAARNAGCAHLSESDHR